MLEISEADRAFLARSIELARGGWAGAHPNPMVGCVIVKGDVVVAEGYHAVFGGPHAEVVALAAAGERARGATAYVSLEPCDHAGKTGPCSAALISAGVARVVYAVSDPSLEGAGGAATLGRSGVVVAGPVFDAAFGRRQNPAFFHNVERGATFVALKLAMSLDAKIAAAVGARTRITGPEAEAFVHELRAGFDAVLVGIETALVDDPRLTVRLPSPEGAQPRRIVLDTRARLPRTARLFEDIETSPVTVFVGSAAEPRRVDALREAGAEVHTVPETAERRLDLVTVFDLCWTDGVRSVLCEGGERSRLP